jgi:hypothetical protein
VERKIQKYPRWIYIVSREWSSFYQVWHARWGLYKQHCRLTNEFRWAVAWESWEAERLPLVKGYLEVVQLGQTALWSNNWEEDGVDMQSTGTRLEWEHRE